MKTTKLYAVMLSHGGYDDFFQWTEFVTDDKNYAEKWITKHNRILEENKERADEYYSSELFYNRDYPYKLDYLREGHPAEIKEIEFRQPDE